jgi:hypothetical protein
MRLSSVSADLYSSKTKWGGGVVTNICINGHQTKLENDDTSILHEADVGDTYNARGVQFTCKLVFLRRIVQ